MTPELRAARSAFEWATRAEDVDRAIRDMKAAADRFFLTLPEALLALREAQGRSG